jgi:aminoglycoside phosphotransferase (APT) family kinase protein
VDTLAALHAVDAAQPALAALGKPAGFVERQVRGWTERWQRSRTAGLPDMEVVAAWLVANLPREPAWPAVVHGDFKLDNVLLDPNDLSRLVAVFDWEMSALGDPLVDLGIFLAYWAPTAPPAQRDALTTVTDRPGWLTREEVVARYAAKSGRDVTNIRFYETFARFANFGERVVYLAEQARQMTGAAQG